MRNPFVLLLLLCITTLATAQNRSDKFCYGTLERDAIYEIVEVKHYIFTGTDTTGLNVKVTKIQIVEPRRELVKKKVKNCDAPDPKDCYIEVMQDIPPVTMNMYTLSGPEVTPEHDVRIERVERVKEPAGHVSIPVVCPKNRSKVFIKRLQEALIAQGYPVIVNGIYDQATQLSITDFQRSNKMAYGDLSLEVVSLLGVK